MMNTTQDPPFVSVVIVNYNDKKVLRPCLESVVNSDYPNIEIIVVDNGSTDESSEFVQRFSQLYPNVRLVQNEHNLGPSTARNLGIDVAQGKYVAFLDNDTRVHPRWLREGIPLFEATPTIGACQCKLILDGTDGIIDCVGEYLGQNGFLVQVVIAGQEKDSGQYDDIDEIFAAKSAGMIARKDVLKRIGGFDDDYFIYMEESDLCWRIWLAGYTIILAPESVVYHKFGSSSLLAPQRKSYLTQFHGTKNYILTLIKNLENKNLIKILPLHIVIWIGISLYLLMKGKFHSSRWILLGISWNFLHLKKVMEKRRDVQKQRVIIDDDLLPKILRRRDWGYFTAKLRSNKQVGNATGWTKHDGNNA